MTIMRNLVRIGIVMFALGIAFAQDPPTDCTVGHLEIGGPAPGEHMERVRPEWFRVTGAKHYRRPLRIGSIPYEEFLAIKDKTLLAVIREFETPHTYEVMGALTARYGEPRRPDGPWIEWSGFSSDAGHIVWLDRACGLRIDAFPSVDPSDSDERSVFVWSKGAPTERPKAADSIR